MSSAPSRTSRTSVETRPARRRSVPRLSAYSRAPRGSGRAASARGDVAVAIDAYVITAVIHAQSPRRPARHAPTKRSIDARRSRGRAAAHHVARRLGSRRSDTSRKLCEPPLQIVGLEVDRARLARARTRPTRRRGRSASAPSSVRQKRHRVLEVERPVDRHASSSIASNFHSSVPSSRARVPSSASSRALRFGQARVALAERACRRPRGPASPDGPASARSMRAKPSAASCASLVCRSAAGRGPR